MKLDSKQANGDDEVNTQEIQSSMCLHYSYHVNRC